MSKTTEIMEFYAKHAWERNSDGILVPKTELLQDRGNAARQWLHPTEDVTMNEQISLSVMKISGVEIAEALRDILLGSNMQSGEHRVMTIGKACLALQNAEFRIRSINKHH